MPTRPLFRLIVLILCAGLLLSCTAPATPDPTATAVPPTEPPTMTPVPPTATFTATPVPPTDTPTATPVPPTKTPTVTPTEPPAATPTRTIAPKPTHTKAPKPTAQPAATKAPTSAPPASNVTSALVVNTFPVTCRVVMWGPADVTMDASAESTSAPQIIPAGTYGWRAFLGGAETGEAGNLEVPAGSMCLFKCDKETLSVRYGCR